MSISNSYTSDLDYKKKMSTDSDQVFSVLYPPLEGRVNGHRANNPIARVQHRESPTSRSADYYDAATVHLPETKLKKKSSKYDLKALEKYITGLIVVIIIAMIIIIGCLIPVLYFLRDTTKMYRDAAKREATPAPLKDPFKIGELEKLLNEITRTARMTKNENDRLKDLVRDSKLFGYCTHNVPSTACLPCSCTPFNDLNNEYECDCTNLAPKRDCKEYYDNGFRISGVYTLQPDGKSNVTVYCDQTNDGGGWEVIQRRTDGSTGFNRDWNEYKLGFGQLHRDFYLGNQHISVLTKTRKQLLITMEDFSHKTYRVMYNQFSVMNEDHKYQLNCSGFISGSVQDHFCKYHSGKQFSTYDNDNDLRDRFNCAASGEGGGGWWYSSCYEANLNGVYYQTRQKDSDGIKWLHVDTDNSLKSVEMKIRRS